MNCEEVLELLDPLVDDELPEHEKAALQTHLTACPTCRQELHELEALRTKLKQVPQYVASTKLMDRVRERLLQEADRSRTGARWSPSLKAAVSHVAAVVLGGLLVYGVTVSREDSELRDKIVVAHVRSLMNAGLVQVNSEDPHTIKPWFAGKIDYAPPVRDTKEEGFALIGGRVEYLQRRTVAALVYQRRKHRINVFVVPDMDGWTIPNGHSVQNGFNLVNWRRDGFSFWAVSDLNRDELISFSRLMAAGQ